jgi:hypothetical protein
VSPKMAHSNARLNTKKLRVTMALARSERPAPV